MSEDQENASADWLVGLDSDGAGNVALPTATNGTPSVSNVTVVSSGGSVEGSFSGFSAWQIDAQASGFVTLFDGTPGTFVVANSVDGGVEASAQLSSRALIEAAANDPTGGMAVVSLDGILRRFDARGALRSETVLPQELGPPSSVGVDRLGNVLVFTDTSQPKGVWVTADGGMGSVFATPGGGQQVTLQPRVGGGFFVQSYGNWNWQIDTLATTTRNLPDWLASRAGAGMHMAYGGKAYAVLSRVPSGETCTAFLEVVSPEGDACATLLLPDSCGPLKVGYDGTILQAAHENQNAECASPYGCSVWQWWPGFLGRAH